MREGDEAHLAEQTVDLVARPRAPARDQPRGLTSRAAALTSRAAPMEAIKEVGAFAGLAAFLGLAVLALLYFAQARDVRRLRENAEFLVEGEPECPRSPRYTADERRPPPRRSPAGARGRRHAPPRRPRPTTPRRSGAPELARQAAERRQRFESRRSGDEGRLRQPVRDVPLDGRDRRRRPDPARRDRLRRDPAPGRRRRVHRPAGGDKRAPTSACPPGQTKVAVLNGTAEPGLAAGFAEAAQGPPATDVGPVTNTESALRCDDRDVRRRATSRAPARSARIVAIQATEPMSQEVRGSRGRAGRGGPRRGPGATAAPARPAR